MRADILILSANEELRGTLTETVSDARDIIGIGNVSAGDSGTAADPARYPVIVIAAPLAEGFGLDSAVRFIERGGSGVIFLTSAANAEKAARKVSGYPIFMLPRPLNRHILCEAIRFTLSCVTKMSSLKEENDALERKLSETKLVNRAVSVLMRYLSVSEEEAHRILRKSAMDRRTALAQTAQDIISTYEYLP